MLRDDVLEEKSLLAICHQYNNFQKDEMEAVAPYFSSVNIIVRRNPIVDMGRWIPLPQLARNTSAYYTIDRSNTPSNTHVRLSPVWYLPTNGGYKRLGKKHYASVRSQVKKQGISYDLIHCHYTWSGGYVGARLKEESGMPLVITGHGYDVYSLPFRDDEWKEKIQHVLNAADHVITVSRSNLACIRKMGISTPVTVIPNGFKSTLFYPRDPLECRKALGLPADRKIVLSVGSLETVKGQKHLVDAAKKVVGAGKDVLFVIVGAGELHAELERQIRSLGMEDHFMLAGGKPHSEVPVWMNACDVFVLPSLNEGNPTVMFECLGCGKPFVGTRVGGVPEIISSKDYGCLAAPADPDDLAEKVLAALDREWDRDAILRYAQRYTWENVAREIAGVYDRVLG